MERCGRKFTVTLTEQEDGKLTKRHYEVDESQYVLLVMAMGEPNAYTTER